MQSSCNLGYRLCCSSSILFLRIPLPTTQVSQNFLLKLHVLTHCQSLVKKKKKKEIELVMQVFKVTFFLLLNLLCNYHKAVFITIFLFQV